MWAWVKGKLLGTATAGGIFLASVELVELSKAEMRAEITRESAANMKYTDLRIEGVTPHIDGLKDSIKEVKEDTKVIRQWVYDLKHKEK